MSAQFSLGGIVVDVTLKDIKNVHLSVYPPTGAVRIAAPSRMSLDTIRVFAISKLGWIKQQQRKLLSQERETPREYIERESHYVWGRRYLLQIVEVASAPSVELAPSAMVLRMRPGTDEAKRRAIVAAWYRNQIRSAAEPLIAKWQPVLGVQMSRLFVQKMRTRWGSCAPITRTIRLNTELAKKLPECLEYIVVHELAHLVVRTHDERFSGLMDTCLPSWRTTRQLLNEAPVGHTNWGY